MKETSILETSDENKNKTAEPVTLVENRLRKYTSTGGFHNFVVLRISETKYGNSVVRIKINKYTGDGVYPNFVV